MNNLLTCLNTLKKSTKTVLLGFLVTVQRVDSREEKKIDEPLPFDSLMSYLMDCSRKSGGFDIILDGCNNGRMNERRIRCFRNKVHCNHIHYEGNFRTDALSNGRKNNRENGKSLSQRKSTK